MRITTNGLLRNYKNNLATSISNLNTAREHVMTQRKYNKASENPSAALRESQLQRKYLKNLDYLSMVKDTKDRQTIQEASLMEVSTAANFISKTYNLEAINATNGPDERKVFATAIREYQRSMVLSMNAKYEDTFVFAGTDGMNAPFELDETTGKLTFRGVDVDSADPRLAAWAKEALYVDLGFGLEINGTSGAVSPSSAFDIALPGISALGYGTDADGFPNNAITLAGKLADALEADPFDADSYKKLLTKFDTVSTNIMNQVTEIGVKSEFLNDTQSRLEDYDITVQEQLSNVAGIDMASAITDFSWAQYAYNAALKVGTSILSPSFIDFMR